MVEAQTVITKSVALGVCEADDQKTPLKTTSPPLSPAAVSPVLPMIARQWLFMHFWWHWDFEAVRRCSWRGSLGELANVWMRVGGWRLECPPEAVGGRRPRDLQPGVGSLDGYGDSERGISSE